VAGISRVAVGDLAAAGIAIEMARCGRCCGRNLGVWPPTRHAGSSRRQALPGYADVADRTVRKPDHGLRPERVLLGPRGRQTDFQKRAGASHHDLSQDECKPVGRTVRGPADRALHISLTVKAVVLPGYSGALPDVTAAPSKCGLSSSTSERTSRFMPRSPAALFDSDSENDFTVQPVVRIVPVDALIFELVRAFKIGLGLIRDYGCRHGRSGA